MRWSDSANGAKYVLYFCWEISMQNREEKYIGHSLETRIQAALNC